MSYPTYDYTFKQYAEECERTARTIHKRDIRAALGLSGEAAELFEKILPAAMISIKAGNISDMMKKKEFHSKQIDVELCAKELGDLLWYVNDACVALGLDIETVARKNIDKLRVRHPDGFTPETAAAKADEQVFRKVEQIAAEVFPMDTKPAK